jgi:hypothetical protein
MAKDIQLGQDDPTVFAKCNTCDPHRPGAHVGTYYGKAFTTRKWARSPKCENCNGTLTKLYEVK